MIDFTNRTFFIFGVASPESIAWGISRALARAGASLVLGYQQRFKSRVLPLVESEPAILGAYPVDLADDEATRQFFAAFAADHPHRRAHGLVHAVAFAPRETFDRASLFAAGEALDLALQVSAHSLPRALRYALPHLAPDSSTIALTYLASGRWVPMYKAMAVAKAALECWVREMAAELGPDGHRVNAISPGPIPTLAASGVPGFQHILEHVARNAPLRRNVSQDDVGGAAAWLLSDLARNVTGQIIYVDAGYSATGVPTDIVEGA